MTSLNIQLMMSEQVEMHQLTTLIHIFQFYQLEFKLNTLWEKANAVIYNINTLLSSV